MVSMRREAPRNTFIYIVYYIIIIAIVSILVLISIQLFNASNGRVIAYYPYITPDGFDWITEGVYLHQLLAGADLTEVVLPILRPPIFVFVAALDSLTGQTGLIIWTVFLISLLGTTFLISILVGQKNSLSLPVLTLTGLIFLLQPLNSLSLFLLSDNFAIFLSLVSFYMIYQTQSTSKKEWGYLVLPIAGLTQTYAMIPGLILLGVRFINRIQARHFRSSLKPFYQITTVVIVFLIATILWRHLMPHRGVPNNFISLKLTFKNVNYYSQLWFISYLPFLPIIIRLSRLDLRKIFNDEIISASGLTIIIIMILSFCYQESDDRFTWIYIPFIIILICRLYFFYSKNNPLNKLFCTLLILFILSFLVPKEFSFRTNLGSFGKSNYKNSWPFMALNSEPLDRLGLKKTSDGCLEITKRTIGDSYVVGSLTAYEKISPNICRSRKSLHPQY